MMTQMVITIHNDVRKSTFLGVCVMSTTKLLTVSTYYSTRKECIDTLSTYYDTQPH